MRQVISTRMSGEYTRMLLLTLAVQSASSGCPECSVDGGNEAGVVSSTPPFRMLYANGTLVVLALRLYACTTVDPKA